MDLDRVQNWGLESIGACHDLTSGGISGGHGTLAGSFTVQVHELGQVEAGFLQDLDLANVHIVKGEDSLAGLGDIGRDRVGDELVHHLLQVSGSHLTLHNVHHLLADLADLQPQKQTEPND